jgi:hypothetical protein
VVKVTGELYAGVNENAKSFPQDLMSGKQPVLKRRRKNEDYVDVSDHSELVHYNLTAFAGSGRRPGPARASDG